MLEWHDFSEDKPKIKHVYDKNYGYKDKLEYSDQILFMIDNELYFGEYHIYQDFEDDPDDLFKSITLNVNGYDLSTNNKIRKLECNKHSDCIIPDDCFDKFKIYWAETDDIQRSFLNYCLLNHKEAL